MQASNLRNIIFFITFSSLATFSCQKLEIERELKIETDSIVNILSRSSIARASIRDIGYGVVNYGHCWSTNQNPTIFDVHTDFGSSEKAIGFESQLENLMPNTKYYIRAYANDNFRIYYTNEQSFFTNNLGKASLRTGEVRYTDTNSISVVSEILSLGEGVDTILQYGHCWSATENPTILDSITNLGIKTAAGEYSGNIFGIQALKNYYIKSYAITSSGTSYGEQVTAQIYGQIPEVELVKIDSVTAHEIYYNANVTSDGGFAIVERGICISTETNPNKEDHGIINGNDNGSYTGAIENLSRATNYFIRAYAVNINGVAYSNEIELRSLPELPIIETKEVTDITTNSAVSGGIIIDDGGEELIEKGICWSREPEPTIDDNYTEGILENNIFTATLNDLIDFTKYYVRAYSSNRSGIVYSDEVEFTSDYIYDTITIVDLRDGQTYKTVKIGNQWWMAENLNYGDYRLNYLEEYNYHSEYGKQYGLSNVCPSGFHIPDDTEWDELANTLGGSEIAGGKMKQTGTDLWISPNTGATDESRFNAVPGGWGYFGNPDWPEYGYNSLGKEAVYFSTTPGDNFYRARKIANSNTSLSVSYVQWEGSAAIRCIRD